MIKILIGIQARSTSSRLSGKAMVNLYNKPLLSWVINACADSARFLEKRNRNIVVDVAILCPVGDEISRNYSRINIVEGDENDVLSRYVKAANIYEPDYICRITGDCPFLTGYLITNHIFKGINFDLDYLSNVDEEVRTELDGRDVEVFSREALNWLDENAKELTDREHVTILLRKKRPEHLKRGHFLNRLDLSDIKLSVDTAEDLDECSNRIENFFKKRKMAEQDVGSQHVFYV